MELRVESNETMLSPTLEWIKNNLATPQDIKPVGRQKVARVAGLVCGGISSFITAPLGYNFGLYVADMANVDDYISRNIFGVYFGATAAVALIALSARISANVWSDFLVDTPQSTKTLSKKDFDVSSVGKLAYNSAILATGAISSTPTVYITHEFFSKYMGYGALILDIPTFLSLSTVRAWSLNKLITGYAPLMNGILNKFSDEEKALIRNIRSKLVTQLQNSINIVKAFNEEEINRFWSTAFEDGNQGIVALNDKEGSFQLEESRLVERIKLIFNIRTASSSPAVADSLIKNFFGFLGVGVGALTPYASYPLGVAVSDALWDYFNVQDENFRAHSAHTFGVCSYLGLAALSSYASKLSFENFFDWGKKLLTNKNVIPSTSCSDITARSVISKFLDLLIFITALSSSTPRAELNEEYIDNSEFYKPIFVISALISGFATDYWAINSFIADMQAKSKKTLTIDLMGRMKTDIARFNDKSILEIDRKINRSSSPGRSSQSFFHKESKYEVAKLTADKNIKLIVPTEERQSSIGLGPTDASEMT